MLSPLDNYYALLDKVDAICGSITAVLGSRVTCQAGCSGCCTAITVFPVEAAAMRERLDRLPPGRSAEIRRLAAARAGGERCPLLDDERCCIYDARPVICRTHGLPILFDEGGARRVDCCPLNDLSGLTLNGSTVIDLDRLNTLLTAVNARYLAECGIEGLPERIPIIEIAGEAP